VRVGPYATIKECSADYAEFGSEFTVIYLSGTLS
jgi:hypothetical protein